MNFGSFRLSPLSVSTIASTEYYQVPISIEFHCLMAFLIIVALVHLRKLPAGWIMSVRYPTGLFGEFAYGTLPQWYQYSRIRMKCGFRRWRLPTWRLLQWRTLQHFHLELTPSMHFKLIDGRYSGNDLQRASTRETLQRPDLASTIPPFPTKELDFLIRHDCLVKPPNNMEHQDI